MLTLWTFTPANVLLCYADCAHSHDSVVVLFTFSLLQRGEGMSR